MLAEYGDMDIALDPFPFSGGLTSCEALWMGVPMSRAGAAARHGRPGLATTLGLTEWAAGRQTDYIRIAATLAADHEHLDEMRQSLRPRMAASPLCDGVAFTRELEAAYRLMWRESPAGRC